MHRFTWDLHYDPLGGRRRRTRRWRRRRRAASHVSRRELAVGRAGHLQRAPDGRRQELDAADHREDGSARARRRSASSRSTRSRRRWRTARWRRRPRCKDARAAADKLRAKPQSAANDALIKEIDAIAPPAAANAAGAGGGGRRARRGGGGRGGARWWTWRSARWRPRRRRRACRLRLPNRRANLASIGPALVAAVDADAGAPKWRRRPHSSRRVRSVRRSSRRSWRSGTR